MYWTKNILAVHITEKCNMNCSYCYLNNQSKLGSIDYSYIDTALTKINPDTLILYGGEPLLFPQIVNKIIETSNKNIIIITNGTLLTDERMEYFIHHKVQIVISIDGFLYSDNLRRGLSEHQFSSIINLIYKYKDYSLLELMVTLHEDSKNFNLIYKMLQTLGISYEISLAIENKPCDIENTQFFSDYKSYDRALLNDLIHFQIEKAPKLRLHSNGLVSRSFLPEEEYIICHINDWDENKFSLGKPQYPNTCKQCAYFHKCPLPHGFETLLVKLEKSNVLEKSFCCQASKLLIEETYSLIVHTV